MAAVAGGLNPRQFGGRDLIGLLERSRHGGYYGRGTITNSSIFGVLALKTAKRPIPRAVVRQILRDQASGGGFDYFPEGQQADMTAAGIQALRAAGYSCRSTPIRRALTALDRFRSGDGYVLGIGQRPNAQSTAWAIQARLACGRAITPAAVVAAGAPDRRRLGALRAVRGRPHLGHRPGAAGAGEAPLADSLTGRPGALSRLGDAPDAHARNFARRAGGARCTGSASIVVERVRDRVAEQARGAVVVPVRAAGGLGHDRVDHAELEAEARRRLERGGRLAALLRRRARGSPRSPRARSPSRSRSPASARGRPTAIASAPPEPPSPITHATIGTRRRAIASIERAIAPACPRCSALDARVRARRVDRTSRPGSRGGRRARTRGSPCA